MRTAIIEDNLQPVHENALDAVIKANEELEYLEVNINLSGFEETMSLSFEDSKKVERCRC